MQSIEKQQPTNFQLAHITSDPITEPEIQIRYNHGHIEHISKEEAFNRLLTKNLEDIMKISWHYEDKLMRCGIIKGEYIPSEVIEQFNLIIDKNDYYCMITNFSFNPYIMPKTIGKVYYSINNDPVINNDYAIEVWYIYKIKKEQTVIEI